MTEPWLLGAFWSQQWLFSAPWLCLYPEGHRFCWRRWWCLQTPLSLPSHLSRGCLPFSYLEFSYCLYDSSEKLTAYSSSWFHGSGTRSGSHWRRLAWMPTWLAPLFATETNAAITWAVLRTWWITLDTTNTCMYFTTRNRKLNVNNRLKFTSV